MSRTYKTDKISVIVQRRITKNQDGEVILPRIVKRKPKIGDIFPISKTIIRGILRTLPPEYFYGLNRIELLPRQNEKIGYPFGSYREANKTIYLYSLPLIWEFPLKHFEKLQKYEKVGAIVRKDDNVIKVEWKVDFMLGLWFAIEVLFHELGHHYVHQYRFKNKKPLGKIYNELVAELNADRIRDLVFKNISKKTA